MANTTHSHAAQARRYYLHVLNGGSLSPSDVGRMVEAIETQEAEIARLRLAIVAYGRYMQPAPHAAMKEDR